MANYMLTFDVTRGKFFTVTPWPIQDCDRDPVNLPIGQMIGWTHSRSICNGEKKKINLGKSRTCNLDSKDDHPTAQLLY